MTETNEKTFPCDSEEVNGKLDRTYVAEDFARYFRTFISSGVFLKESTNLQVMANGDMTVTLMPGSAIINGYRYDNPEEIIIQLTPADGVLNRIDRISVTWSAEDGDIHYTVQEGISSYQPYAPNCRRTADYKDYVVADVYVGAGAVSIKQGDITDTRLNSEICGLAVAFSDIDTTSIFNQFESWFQKIKAAGELSYDNLLKIFGDYTEEYQQMFLKWFAYIEGQLSEDAAGHLQNQINDLKACDSKSREMLGDVFSTEKEYTSGDYCIYNNTLYKFTKSKDAGEWDPDVVKVTTVQNELAERLEKDTVIDDRQTAALVNVPGVPVGCQAFSALNNDLTDSSTGKSFRFGVTSDGKPGYWWPNEEGGADSVHPFSDGFYLPQNFLINWRGGARLFYPTKYERVNWKGYITNTYPLGEVDDFKMDVKITGDSGEYEFIWFSETGELLHTSHYNYNTKNLSLSTRDYDGTVAIALSPINTTLGFEVTVSELK